MSLKKSLQITLMCAIAIGCLCVTANAQDVEHKQILNLEEMECEQVETLCVSALKKNTMVCSTNYINATVAGYAHSVSNQKVYLVDRGIISINCSYSPSAASVGFGVIAPDGYFYFLNVEGGNINRSIRVNQNGSYAVAIRNNSSDTIYVAGFVNY